MIPESLAPFLGLKHAGVDEVGRGPLAGPVFAAAVIISPTHPILDEVRDSKKLTEKRREILFDEIMEAATCYAIADCSSEEIDEINILQAALLAMRKAVLQLDPIPEHVWVDGLHVPSGLPCPGTGLVKGDGWHPLISAASIMAKVSRDRVMIEWDQKYPEYGFAKHKGYGTKMHLEALKKYGPCPIHRKTFAPVRVNLV